MIRASALVAALAFGLASCSGIKSYELGLRGSPDLNRNEDNQPNPVQVRVLRLKGDEAAKAFSTASFDELWAKPAEVQGLALEGAVQSVYVPAAEKRTVVQLKEVPPSVTHFGLLGLFNKPETGKERLLLTRDQVDAADVVLQANWLGAPAGKPAAAPAPRQD